MELRKKVYKLLRKSERYTKTDNIYLAKSSFWINLSKIINSLGAFFVAVAFANIIPKETYGTYKYILSMGTIFAIFTLPGIETAIIQHIAKKGNGSLLPIVKTRLRWGILGGIASLILAGYYFINHNITLTISFLITAPLLPLVESIGIYRQFLQGKKMFKTYSIYVIIVQTFTSLGLIAVLFLTKNLYLIVLAYFILYIISHYIFLKKTIKKFSLCQEEENKQIISHGKHFTLMDIISRVAKYFDKIVLWHFLGAIPLAIYSFAVVPPTKISSVFSTINRIALPKFSNRSLKELSLNIWNKILRMFIFLIPITIIYILIAPYIFRIFFPGYLESIKYSQIFSITILLIPLNLVSTIFTSQIKKKELYILNLTSPTFKIVLLLILVSSFGIMGAIYSIIGGEIFKFLLGTILLKKSPK